jgi:hypothetical protein
MADRLDHNQAMSARRIGIAALRMLGPMTEVGGTILDEIDHIRANLDHIERIERAK